MSRPTLLAQLVGMPMDPYKRGSYYGTGISPIRYDEPEPCSPPIGLGPVRVAARAKMTVTHQAQILFRPKLLVIPAILAYVFLVADVKIGRNSQLQSVQGVGAFMFQEGSDPGIKWDVLHPGMILSVTVANLTDRAADFIGCFTSGKAGKVAATHVNPIRDPLRLCSQCGAPPKKGHDPESCYYCGVKR